MDPGHTQKAPEYYPSEDTPGSTEQAEEAKPRNLKTTLVVRAVQVSLSVVPPTYRPVLKKQDKAGPGRLDHGPHRVYDCQWSGRPVACGA